MIIGFVRHGGKNGEKDGNSFISIQFLAQLRKDSTKNNGKSKLTTRTRDEKLGVSSEKINPR